MRHRIPWAPRRTGWSFLLAGGWHAGLISNALVVAGGVLLAASGIIHFHLWETGYRQIATIGPLFLFQFVGAIAIALLAVVTRRMFATILGALFAISTIAGFILSCSVGLFGFKDSWSAPFAVEALASEVAAVVIFAIGGLFMIQRFSFSPET